MPWRRWRAAIAPGAPRTPRSWLVLPENGYAGRVVGQSDAATRRSARARIVEHGKLERRAVRKLGLEPDDRTDELDLPYGRFDPSRRRGADVASARNAQGLRSQT